MILGTVIGEVHGTIKHRFLEGKRMLVVEKQNGEYLIALDSVDAGAGETVLVLDEGNGARQIFDSADAPVRSVVVGIVDDVMSVGARGSAPGTSGCGRAAARPYRVDRRRVTPVSILWCHAPLG